MHSPDRRINKSKNALKKSLLTLMKEKEFKSITITEIVALADLNRGTFYKHYQYKEDLLDDVIHDVIEDLIESFRAPYRDNSNFFKEELSSSAIKLFDHVAKYADFYTIIIHSNVLPGFQNKICDVLKEIALQDLLLDKTASAINPELLASYQAYALLGLIVEWVKGGFKYTPQYMTEQLIEILAESHFAKGKRKA
ncbi:TetR/AcrR family transcriptional regulator C-terminal domain-containing protein [Bacillus sp. 1P06AnD]|uniref:TetR/AcrR family transcriptional regulator n=1 Tax=Bacillus sp. 1P06AnD TaxID=3132208 RepID=UPI00399F3655